MSQAILVVDDDKAYLLATRRLLEGAGYEVRTADSAEEARSQLQSQRPDLILLDVLMPGEDGFSLADGLAGQEQMKGVPVVLVTAVAETPGPVIRAFEQNIALDVADVLPKSAVHKRLLETVASALGGR